MNNKGESIDVKKSFKKEHFVIILTTISFCFLLAVFISNSQILLKIIYLLLGICFLIMAGFILKKSQKTKEQVTLKNIFKIKCDSSLIFLIITNLIVIFLAVIQKWDLAILFFIYWCQTLIIGVFSIIKILNLKNLETENIALNGGTLKKARINAAGFVAFGFVILHYVYLLFILRTLKPDFTPILFIILSIFAFFINHLFSFLKNFKHDTEKKQNLTRFVFFPFARTIPMHLIILFGFVLVQNRGILVDSRGIALFLLLKTIADVIMHNWEHRD